MAINKNVLAEKQATVLSEDGNTMYATIQMRHGKESEMDKSKFVPAEMGVATDTKKAFMAFGSNQVKEMMFREDSEIEELLDEVREISDKAVEAVESAEATAKQAIEDYTEQMKATIPEDYTEMVKKVDVLERTKAPAIMQTVSGESLQIEDSADAPMAGLRVFGKSRQVVTTGAQLFDASKLPTKTQGGATVTNNGDGSFTISGSGNLTDNFGGVNYSIYSDDFKKLFKVGNVYLKGAINKGIYFEVAYIKSDGNLYQRNDKTINLTNEIYNAITSVKIGFYGNSGSAIPNETIKPMLYQDGDGTWEPYTGGKPAPSPDYPQEIEVPGSEGSIIQAVFGRNLIDTDDKSKWRIASNSDSEFELLGNGKIKVTGSSSYSGINCDVDRSIFNQIKCRKLYIHNSYSYSSGRPIVQIRVSTPSGLKYYNKTNNPITIPQDSTSMIFNVCVNNRGTALESKVTIEFSDVGLYIGQDVDSWEPYREPKTLTISTPNGLPGIPVDSGGNYTDSDGQQWICDEVDFKHGKYVQRVKKLGIDDFTIDSNIDPGTTGARFTAIVPDKIKKAKQQALCNYFPFNNVEHGSYGTEGNYIATDETQRVFIRVTDDITLEEFKQTYPDLVAYYQLDTPIETDLSEEELTAYADLRTNYPTTVVTSDSDPEVGIEVEYVADTQKYIDNKFAELAQNLAATQNTLLEV